MTEAASSPVTFPTVRENRFDPPAVLVRSAQENPIRPMTYADGHEGWLVTGFALARAVLADLRFSNLPDLVHSPISPQFGERRRKRRPGFFLGMDPPEHTRYRRLLTGQFTVRRMKRLEPWIETITAERLDAMELEGPPTDLVRSFALPIPSLVICELLGVPYSDRDRFQRDSRTLLRLDSTVEEAEAAINDLTDYLRDLVRHKRARPADDLISGMLEGGELNDEEMAGISVLLLVAGHETTANMIALGTFALLSNPSQLAAVRDDPSVTDSTVEELLRYLTIVHLGPIRCALEDVELGGRLIKAGQSVTISLSAANRDGERFEDPGTLDVARPPSGHLSFGHGVHQCLGQQLARTEMSVAYPALLRRFPNLSLAIPPEEVPMRTNMAIYGVDRLPVTW
ncbi:cytochrome P450 [Streptosporangium sp. 'caverna']|uniref:cytochrome P450 n=1 Tax=Streptosporangium sp. 'caverna' TaxID=2202249 RepID=UPI000D7E6BA0|nr:cytochrome P450 [Streptosporangium sp. 'caverna']AWS45015.1 cytochrome P450 [Streptosporangium sp. 'caverna']